MGRMFLSYRRTDQAEVRVLARALRRAGVRPWRDEDNLALGRPTEAQIQAALRDECDGAVLWLTSEALESDFIMRVELRPVVEAARAGQLSFTPVFVGMTPEHGAQQVKERTGLWIGGYHGERVSLDEDLAAAARRIAAGVVRARLDVRARSAHQRPILRAVTYADTAGGRSEAVLDFDWRHAYADGQPDPITQADLKAALKTSASALLDAYGRGEVRLEANTHLSVGVALGHTLARPTNAVPVIAVQGGYWQANDAVDPAAPLEERLEYGAVDDDELAVEVSVTHDVTKGVTALVQERAQPFRARLHFYPPDGPAHQAVPDAHIANAWAQQISQRMTNVRNDVGAASIALFMAAPLPIAVLLGWWCNAAGRITIYEWVDKVGPYRPGWTLP